MAAANTGAAAAEAAEADPDPHEVPPAPLPPPPPDVTPAQLATWHVLVRSRISGRGCYSSHRRWAFPARQGWEGVDSTHPILAVVDWELLCALPQALELEPEA